MTMTKAYLEELRVGYFVLRIEIKDVKVVYLEVPKQFLYNTRCEEDKDYHEEEAKSVNRGEHVILCA
jgi:hypothetical protein